ncbi:sensor histidine kinase [Longispora fulva]|uniref:histidine kinase n=2 Tax=Longispora fulva TaxID=619741 RepID=A0A8J7G7S0_9ACTN|nr:histidine kinase [Longispora fulva]MBG6134485.1 signal transduction histidine kinase [Longispora fulva]
MLVALIVLTTLVPPGAPYRDARVLDVALVGVSAVCLIWRQVRPLTVIFATSAMLVLSSAIGFPPSFMQWPAWISLFTCYSLLGLRPRTLAALAAGSAVGGYILLDRSTAGPQELVWVTACFLAATVGGDTARTRRTAAEAALRRAAIEARERALDAERIVAQERRLLAGELHDALGHAVNVMVMQAGVARRVFDDNPQFAREALGHIETVGRGALDELDHMLQILHPVSDGADVLLADSATPDLTDLTDLAGQVRAAGRELELELNLGDIEVSARGARTLHRVVQEAVTNALRHTSSGPIRVGLSQEGTDVRLEIINDQRGHAAPATGRGLINMRERVLLEGGRFQAGPVDDSFRVLAVIPARADLP